MFLRRLDRIPEAREALARFPGSKATAVYRKPLDAIARDAEGIKYARGMPPSVALPRDSVGRRRGRVTGVSPWNSSCSWENSFSQAASAIARRGCIPLSIAARRERQRSRGLSVRLLCAKEMVRSPRAVEGAMEFGISDPCLCYRDAVLAQEAGMDVSEIRGALERAVAVARLISTMRASNWRCSK